jgi:hypothetical protein
MLHFGTCHLHPSCPTNRWVWNVAIARNLIGGVEEATRLFKSSANTRAISHRAFVLPTPGQPSNRIDWPISTKSRILHFYNTISPVADQLQKWHTSTGINFAFSESKSNVQHPQQLRMKFSRLLLISTISLVAATLPAQAASYKSANGTTLLDLNESGNRDLAGLPKNSGGYVTFRGGNRVNGGITILTRNAAANNVTYTGTFEDYVGRPDTGCKGTITLNRTLLVGGRVALRSEWRIGQSGSRCQSPVGTQGSGELSGKPACC